MSLPMWIANGSRQRAASASWLCVSFVLAILVVACSPTAPPTSPVAPADPWASSGTASALAPVAGAPATVGPTVVPTSMPPPGSPAATFSPAATMPTVTPKSTATLEPSATPEPSRTLEPTPGSTPQPPSTLAYRETPLRTDGLAEVVAWGLELRSLPTDRPESSVVPVHVWHSDRLLVLAGPVGGPQGDAWGDWYQVATPAGEIGWAAANHADGTPRLAGRAPRCPALPVGIETLAGMSPFEQLVRFGSRSLTFDATYGFYTWDGPGGPWGTPEWLTGGSSHSGMPIQSGRDRAFASVVFSPGARVSDLNDEAARITGHLDDPASSTCRTGWIEDADPTSEQVVDIVNEASAESAVLGCRLTFVVTESLGRHRVQPGETLRRIAREHSVSLANLLVANTWIRDPDLIHVGDLLTIPPRPAG